eukprot:CAMPEP_0181320720 /NCGR_PEP_ID=MMETSP1101-20121128/18279_1 /TAXON_ID=46948 /ORGANISM="Rhodomonas abbreviata, Strain Caron Lab Isolate" /LENGTH=167 /DNA_ID=CAMNT_0023428453 /DNA_START=341 /DNA_END=844 /DNA_ORIENTATION=-
MLHPKTSEAETVAEQDVSPSQSVAQSIEIKADMEACFLAASDVDNYMQWCRGGGMKRVDILERIPEDGRCSKVRFTAGALGIAMINTMGYEYDDENLSVVFKSLEGDVMKTLDGCYRFEPGSNEGETLVTYELLLGFGSKLPDFAVKAITNAIIRTALGALKNYVEN